MWNVLSIHLHAFEDAPSLVHPDRTDVTECCFIGQLVCTHFSSALNRLWVVSSGLCDGPFQELTGFS